MLQRSDRRRDSPGVEIDLLRIAAVLVWKTLEPSRQESADIGVGLLDRYPALQPCNARAAERRRAETGAGETERDQKVGRRVENAEPLRHHADDLRGCRVHRDRAPHDVRITAEPPLPVGVREHDVLRHVRAFVRRVEPAAEQRRDRERLQNVAHHRNGRDLLGFADPRHARRGREPHPDVRERSVLVLICHEHRRRQPEPAGHVREPRRTGCGVPDRHELVGIGIRQRLQQHAVDDAEHRGVRAATDCEREQRYGREQRTST